MSAILSECGRYRYRLERGPFNCNDLFEVASDGVYELRGKVVGFFGVNPSTADSTEDDATVRKWIGFCKAWGAKRFIVGNVFAYRATDVKKLLNDPEPAFSLVNQEHLKSIARDADILVPCWGNRAKVPVELRHIFDATLGLLQQTGKPLMHFGLTDSGDPKHPLMLGYSTPLTPWSKT